VNASGSLEEVVGIASNTNALAAVGRLTLRRDIESSHRSALITWEAGMYPIRHPGSG